MRLRRSAILAFAIPTACALVASCGGGGSSTPATCSSSAAFSVTAEWNSNGSVGSTVVGKLGVPLTATPVLTGVPASCVASESFSLHADLPAGLSLDSKTGVISGTPTQAISTGAPMIVTLDLPGYNSVNILSIITITN
jgi:hypothetical protein